MTIPNNFENILTKAYSSVTGQEQKLSDAQLDTSKKLWDKVTSSDENKSMSIRTKYAIVAQSLKLLSDLKTESIEHPLFNRAFKILTGLDSVLLWKPYADTIVIELLHKGNVEGAMEKFQKCFDDFSLSDLAPFRAPYDHCVKEWKQRIVYLRKKSHDLTTEKKGKLRKEVENYLREFNYFMEQAKILQAIQKGLLKPSDVVIEKFNDGTFEIIINSDIDLDEIQLIDEDIKFSLKEILNKL